MRFLAATVFTLFLVAFASDVQSGDAKKDQDKIQGAWDVVDFIVDGKPLPEDVRATIKIVFKDNTMQIGKGEFTFKLDSTKKPNEIDTMPLQGPFKGKTGQGIYELNGDSLKLCMPNSQPASRPKEFKSEPGPKNALLVLKRGKS